MKTQLSALLGAFLITVSHSTAGVVVTFAQDGNDVTASWSGSLDPGQPAAEYFNLAPSLTYSGSTTLYSAGGYIFYDAWNGGNANSTALRPSIGISSTYWGFNGANFYFPGSGLYAIPADPIYRPDGSYPAIVDFGDGSAYVMRFSNTNLAAMGADAFNNTLAWTSSAGEDNTVVYMTVPVFSLSDFTSSFGATASMPRVVYALPSTIINGSHHRVLLEQDELTKGNPFWVMGDIADHNRLDAYIGTSEVGMAHDFGPGLRGGLGVGYGYIDQDLSYGGSHELDGQYLLGELDYRIPDTKVILSATAVYGAWESDISRGYPNGGATDLSHGETDIDTMSLRLRADWLDLFEAGGFSFSPRIAYTLTRINRDSYSETGGGFPASFDKDRHTTKELRAGLTAEKKMTEKLTLRGILEGVHRDDEQSGNFSGSVSGLFDFSIPGQAVEENWARAGIETSYQIDENKYFTGTVFGSTEGEDPQMTVGLNLKVGF